MNSSKLTQNSDMFTKSDMLNKNTLGVKKCKANKKQPYLCVTKSFDISAEVKKLPIKVVSNYLNDILYSGKCWREKTLMNSAI